MYNHNYVGDLNHNGDTVLRQTNLTYETARDIHFKVKQFMNSIEQHQEEIDECINDT